MPPAGIRLRAARCRKRLERQMIAMNKTLAFTLAVVAAATFGCGKSKTYESSDGKVTVSEDSGTAKYEVKTKDGNATMAMSDSEVKIPDTFPKDVPILKGAVAKLSMTQGKNEVLNLQVPGSIADVAKDYQDKLKEQGWEIETTMNMGESSMVHAKKDNRKCVVMVMKGDDGTMVQLTVSEE